MRTTSSFWYPNTDLYSYATGSGALSISGNSYGNALVCYVPYTTTVDKLAFYCQTTTLAGDLLGQIETVTSSTNLPTGTLYHANATGTRSMLTSDDNVWAEITFAAPVTITGGDLIAVTVGRTSGTFTGTLRRVVSNGTVFPILAERSGGAWGLTSARVPCTILHSTTDGWLSIPGGPVYEDLTTTSSITSASSPDEVGAKLIMPFTARLVAVNWHISGATSSDAFTLRLYDGSNNVLWSKSHTFATDIPTTNGSRVYPIPSRPTLKKGGTYRFAMEVTTGTLTTQYMPLGTGYELPAGLNNSFMQTSRTDAGAWTDFSTRVPYTAFLFDKIGTNVPAHGMMR